MDLELEWNGQALSTSLTDGRATVGGGRTDSVKLDGARPGLLVLDRAGAYWIARVAKAPSFSGRPFPAHVPRVWLPGELLQVGTLRCSWKRPAGEEGLRSTAVMARHLLGSAQLPHEAASASLLCLCGKDLGRRLVLGRTGAVLGRSAQAQLRLLDESISRAHLAFARGPGGWWVEDLGSPNALRVDGKPWRRTALTHGAVLELGRVHLRFEAPGVATPPPVVPVAPLPELPVARDVAPVPDRMPAPAVDEANARWLRAAVGLAGAAALLGLGWS